MVVSNIFFPIIYGIILSIDELIFFRGVETTSQICFFCFYLDGYKSKPWYPRYPRIDGEWMLVPPKNLRNNRFWRVWPIPIFHHQEWQKNMISLSNIFKCVDHCPRRSEFWWDMPDKLGDVKPMDNEWSVQACPGWGKSTIEFDDFPLKLNS